MHICILPSWYPNDKNDTRGSFFQEQAEALASSGNKVGVIYINRENYKRVVEFSRLKKGFSCGLEKNLFVVRHNSFSLPKCKRLNRYLNIRNAEKAFLKYIAKYGKPDVFHVHSIFQAGTVGEYFKKKYGIPFVITEHNSLFLTRVLSRYELEECKRISNSSSYNIAVSDHLSDKLQSTFGNQWHFIPNMVNMKFKDSSSIIKNDGDFKFLAISYLTENKGIDVLLEAFSKVRKTHPNTRLLIGGDGRIRQKLEALAIDLDVMSSTEFLGALSREQVFQTIKTCDAFVHASYHETFGVVLVEAGLLGKPVVSTRCGGPESIIQDGFNGYLCNVGDAVDLSHYMRKVIDNYQTFSGNDISSNTINEFGSDAIVKKLEKVYSLVINKGNNDNAIS